MLTWLTAQPTSFIALIVFGFIGLIAALIFAIVTGVAKRHGSSDFKAISPVTLTPLSVIAGLLRACCTIQNLADVYQHIVSLTPRRLLYFDAR
jgi:hypothetical protein